MKSRFKIYLAGPIAGLTFDEGNDWREYVRRKLPPEIVAYSPLRGKEYLRAAGQLSSRAYDEHPLSTARGVLNRDRHDVRTCDAVLMNVLSAPRVSLGTVMEMAWADAYRKPVVLAMESGNIHEHLLFNECAAYRTANLDQALELLLLLVLPELPEGFREGGSR